MFNVSQRATKVKYFTPLHLGVPCLQFDFFTQNIFEITFSKDFRLELMSLVAKVMQHLVGINVKSNCNFIPLHGRIFITLILKRVLKCED